jgi:hypothetical protein
LSNSMSFDSHPGKGSAQDEFIQALYDDLFGTTNGASNVTYDSGETGVKLLKPSDHPNYPWKSYTADELLPLNMAKVAASKQYIVPTPVTDSDPSKAYWKAFFTYLNSNYPSGTVNVSYKNYVQFLMDYGRDKPVVEEVKDRNGNVTQAEQYSILSTLNPNYHKHSELTDGGTLDFPPPEMPTHAVRRAVIAALAIIKDRNSTVNESSQRDLVSIVVFDRKNGVKVLRSLTDDYTDVMKSAAQLQACSSGGNCTDSEGGIICAANHIKAQSQGGAGRLNANKVIVFLTDGNPNINESSEHDIDDYKAAHSGDDWGSNYAQNGALMQSSIAQGANSSLYAVGVGEGGNQTFMDRMARNAGTDKNGAGYPIASDSATYEATLKSIFQGIISNPKLRLVQ